MKGGHNKKSVRVEFVMSKQEAELVKGRMAELGITNLSAYLRKMAVDGYIIHLDMSDIQEKSAPTSIPTEMNNSSRLKITLFGISESSFLIGIHFQSGRYTTLRVIQV